MQFEHSKPTRSDIREMPSAGVRQNIFYISALVRNPKFMGLCRNAEANASTRAECFCTRIIAKTPAM
jgi:hypothetical protein